MGGLWMSSVARLLLRFPISKIAGVARSYNTIIYYNVRPGTSLGTSSLPGDCYSANSHSSVVRNNRIMSPMGDSSTPQYQPRNMVSSWFSASPPDLVMTTIFPSISRPTSGWPRRQWRRINQSEPCKVLCVFKTWCEIHLYIFLFFSIKKNLKNQI